VRYRREDHDGSRARASAGIGAIRGSAMQFVRGWIAAVALLCTAFAASPAQAIEVACVEASRYKHIMRIFGNDTARFAAFFRSNPNQLPHPEACRALIVTGGVERFPRGTANQDFVKLAQAIAEGKGWVTTVYLASPGGSIATGLRLGELIRMFWLNTFGVANGRFEYVPDFLGTSGPGSPAAPPPELESGYRDFQAATQSFSRLATDERNARRCVSACTFMHVAGIYRHGDAHFHRGRASDRPKSMTELNDSLQSTETRVLAYFRAMDAGDDAIDAYQHTATETTSSVTPQMMPRYVRDYLKKDCAFPAARPGETVSPSDARRAAKREFPEGFSDIKCIAASNSRERLLQFAKVCPNGCDLQMLFEEAGKRVNALVPGERSNNERQQPRFGPQSYRPR
jgi:hypothetical protein